MHRRQRLILDPNPKPNPGLRWCLRGSQLGMALAGQLNEEQQKTLGQLVNTAVLPSPRLSATLVLL